MKNPKLERFKVIGQEGFIMSPKIQKGVDLQLHTMWSDGICSPQELLYQANDINLNVISITDHNSLKGYSPSLFKEADSRNMFIIPGVEIDCYGDLDILVYDKLVNNISDHFVTQVKVIIDRENKLRYKLMGECIERIKNFLSSSNFHPQWLLWETKSAEMQRSILESLTLKNLMSIDLRTGEIRSDIQREYVSKVHMGRLLHKFDLIDWKLFAQAVNATKERDLIKMSQDFLFTEIAHWKLSGKYVKPNEDLLREIGNLGFLKLIAHPGKSFPSNVKSPTRSSYREFLWYWISNYNLDGAECYYGNYKKDEFDFNKETFFALQSFSEKLSRPLYGTGGSDQHGMLIKKS